jgi:hypothetical protein
MALWTCKSNFYLDERYQLIFLNHGFQYRIAILSSSNKLPVEINLKF